VSYKRASVVRARCFTAPRQQQHPDSVGTAPVECRSGTFGRVAGPWVTQHSPKHGRPLKQADTFYRLTCRTQYLLHESALPYDAGRR
jgi:hypothetical protein